MTLQIDRLRTYQTPKPKYRCCVCDKQSTRYRNVGGKLVLICANCEEAKK